MEKIDIVTTATLRPALLAQTYESFTGRIFRNIDRYRLIINIDPIGERSSNQKDVLKVAKSFFKEVVYNLPSEPSFPKAVMWLWSNTTSDYVFHLEDDWVVNKKINMDYMISILDKYEKICSVRLSKGTIFAGRKPVSAVPCPYIQSEDVGKFKLFPRISFNPTLFRGKFVREAVKIMTPELNPESQLVEKHARRKEKKHNKNYGSDKLEAFLKQWEHSVLTIHKSRAVVRDVGISWRHSNKIRKIPDFVYWS